MDRDKYRRLFIDEAKEGLALIQNELVAVEKAQRSRGAATAAADGAEVSGPEGTAVTEGLKPRFDAVFRSAHSLKGMGAAMGYTRFAALAHHLEDLADLGREGHALPPEAYDLLLEGTDVLESCVHKVEAGDDDPDAGDLATKVAAFVLTLRAPATATAMTTAALSIAAAPTPTTATAASVDPPSPPASSSAAAPSSSPPSPSSPAFVDGDVSVVRVQIAADASAPLVRAFVVLKALQGLPGFIDSHPNAEALRQQELPVFQKQRLLEVRFARGESLDTAVEKARACQGVKDVTVIKVESKEKDDAKDAAAKDAADHRTVRVRTALLDDLIDSVGEVLLTRSRLRALAVKLELPELNDLVDEVDRLTRELHGRVVAARMTPLSILAERLPRLVRDLARQQKKSVDFTMSGMDIELDRAILDELQAPLLHMVRNAVDHGHEGDDARAAANKGVTMRLSLRATRDRDRVLLTLEDDGKGMDPVALRARAVARGLIDKARADALNDDAALELVCLPGFSTADVVSETSGRGVGMDVVKSSLEKLGGALRLSSSPGKGSAVTLQLPLTVAIIQVLVIDVSDDSAFVLPVARVEAALAVDDDAVSSAAGRDFIRVGGELVPLLDLPAWLGLAPLSVPGTAILVRSQDGLVALRVRTISAQEEVVAKPLGPPLSAIPFVAGATVLADGRAAFILEPQRLSTTSL
jgi:two-component system chemotaxis sensor kinase CheA